ncbi:hypothetical protein [Mycobacterium sp.]|uniref:hypothetical protein n=1 Tax=Mycobacterium sp. TaxID=1785 RepID=UPI003C748536
MSIDSVEVTTDRGDGTLTKVGQDTYQLAPNAAHQLFPPQMTFEWTSHGQGNLSSSTNCTVVANVTGPGGYDQTRRSSDCSGRPNKTLDVLTPGTYTVNVSVTPPNGGQAVTGTKTFQLIEAGR